MKDLDKWVQTELVKALVYSGFGIQGIADTAFYRFVSSPQGLSELGIEASEPPKLLDAYERTIKVDRTGQQLRIKFGDWALLKMLTPHPAAGTGNLHVTSWLEFVVDGLTVDRGFVPRARLPKSAEGSIRLGAPLGGLMLPRGVLGSTGLWRFPAQLRSFEQSWLQTNVTVIQNAIVRKTIELLAQRLSRG